MNSLSLPPDTDPGTYIEYEVLKPIPNVTTGEIAAWGDSAGGGNGGFTVAPTDYLDTEVVNRHPRRVPFD